MFMYLLVIIDVYKNDADNPQFIILVYKNSRIIYIYAKNAIIKT